MLPWARRSPRSKRHLDRFSRFFCFFSYSCPLLHKISPDAECHAVAWQQPSLLYTVSQKTSKPLVCYNFDAHEWILIFIGRNVADKVGNQKTLYYATSNNLCFCTTWQNAETRKSHISLNWIVLRYTHNAPVRCLPERTIVICDVFDSV